MIIYDPTTTDDDWRIDMVMQPFRVANEIWLKLHPIKFDAIDFGNDVMWSARMRYGFGISYGNCDNKSPFVFPSI